MPILSFIYPPTGLSGGTARLLGSGFGASAGEHGQVTFHDGKVATVLSWSNFSIVVTVPADATTGNVGMVMADGSTFSNVLPYAISGAYMPPVLEVPAGGLKFTDGSTTTTGTTPAP